MPIYRYLCQDCENEFEVKASLSEKEKGLKVNCSYCGGNKTVQVFGRFFTFSKGGNRNSGGGCCGPNPTPGCCG